MLGAVTNDLPVPIIGDKQLTGWSILELALHPVGLQRNCYTSVDCELESIPTKAC